MSSWFHRGLSVILAALLTGCVRAAPATPELGAPLLTVVAWNMHDGRGDLSRLLDHLHESRLGNAPDYVLLLQEARDSGEDGVETLAAARGLSVAFRRTPGRDIGNAILSTLPIAATRTLELPRERQPRGALMARVAAAGVPFFIVTAHLENRLGWQRGLFGDRARGRQAAALLRQLPDGYGIVGGDMNTMLGPDEPAWRLFLERFPDTPPRPEPTFRDRLVLDHLFFDLPPGWLAARLPVESSYGSDHTPVVGIIRVSRDALGPTDGRT